MFNGIDHYDFETALFPRYSGLDSHLEFFYDREMGDLYLYCAYGLPDEYFDSIELCDTGHGIGGESDNVTIDNIAICGTGSFAIGYDHSPIYGHDGAQPIRVTIQNCAFYYTGGGVYMQYPGLNEMDYPLRYNEMIGAFNLAEVDVAVNNCYAVLRENVCHPDCTGKDDAAVTLIGRKHYFEGLGITAANVGEATLDTRNYQMYEESIGYVKGHTKVLVTAVKE